MNKFFQCIRTGLITGTFCGMLFVLFPLVILVPCQLIIGFEPMSDKDYIGWLRICGVIGFILFVVGFLTELSIDRKNGSMM